ncbi:hypothetical protein P9E34_14260 [Schinkia azotoformans]|uniref:hypothetical protein n=1 Tax=Schinkia azotoformans TaxID=1454 RepID=UPI002DBF864D|nr:hypothetical protein [Schinkia azotoformans]MEC1725878.1 hypothetical protein [Schinkia azotoformans]
MNKLEAQFKKNLKVEYVNGDRVVTYKGFPIWKTCVGLDKLQFSIYDPTKKEYSDDPDYYLLQCQDNLGDWFYYGRFHDEDSLEEFLDKPHEYHTRQQRLMEEFFSRMRGIQ